MHWPLHGAYCWVPVSDSSLPLVMLGNPPAATLSGIRFCWYGRPCDCILSPLMQPELRSLRSTMSRQRRSVQKAVSRIFREVPSEFVNKTKRVGLTGTRGGRTVELDREVPHTGQGKLRLLEAELILRQPHVSLEVSNAKRLSANCTVLSSRVTCIGY